MRSQQLGPQLIQAALAHTEWERQLEVVGELLSGHFPLGLLLLLRLDILRQRVVESRTLAGEDSLATMLAESLREAWHRSGGRQHVVISQPSEGLAWAIVAVPLPTTSQDEILILFVEHQSGVSLPSVVEGLGMAAATLALRRDAIRHEREAAVSAALLDLLARCSDQEQLRDSCRVLADETVSLLACQSVAVGLCRPPSRHCRIEAISNLARFDRHAELTTAYEAAFDETLLINDIVTLSAAAPDPSRARALEHLRTLLGADTLISAPLVDERGAAIGVLLAIGATAAANQPAPGDFLRAAQRPVAAALRQAERAQGGRWTRTWRKLASRMSTQRRTWLVAGSLLLAALLAWPFPHRISCECRLQPVVRRFVAAPFDGTLERTLVEPGDVVAAGQTLAIMDGRELRLELAALEADYNRARKSWEASLSLEEYYEAQQARLDMQRLEMQIELLRGREARLQITSPHVGIVTSGDLKKSEGIPLSEGQTLFEIAPLDRMRVEIAIPEEDIAHVPPDVVARVRLDAFPRDTHLAPLARIVPRAELRDEKQVFVAELELDNAAGKLRPGMSGRATLLGPRRSLAWLLFHKPFESLLLILGW